MSDLGSKMFLSAEMIEVIKDMRESKKNIFELCEKLNCLSNSIIFDIKVDHNDKQQLLISCLFIRAISTYQGVIILAERGMPSETTVVLRTLLEVLFRICAIAKDVNVADIYIQEDEIYRKKSIYKINKLGKKTIEAIGNPDLADLLKDIKENIAVNDIKDKTSEWYAQMAGLADFYHSAYSIFSRTVHVYARDLESALVLDSNDEVIGFNYGPDGNGLDLLLLTAVESMIHILDSVRNVFSTKYSDEVDSINKEFEAIYHGT